MKVLLINSELSLSKIKASTEIQTIYGRPSTIYGTIAEEDQQNPSSSARIVSSSNIDIDSPRVTITTTSETKNVIIFYYNSSGDFLGKNGASIYDLYAFQSGTPFNVLNFETYSKNTDEVSASTIKTMAKSYRIVLRNPTPQDGISVNIKVV